MALDRGREDKEKEKVSEVWALEWPSLRLLPRWAFTAWEPVKLEQ